MDITQLILDDHHEQRRLFAIIEQIDPSDSSSLISIWRRLATFLEVHAETEEKLFYPALLRVGRDAGHRKIVEDETLAALKDQNENSEAEAAVRGEQVGTLEWFQAVAAANKANGDHMAEEEREGLTDFRRKASLQLRHDLAIAFASYEAEHVDGVAPVDKDPKRWVAEH